MGQLSANLDDRRAWMYALVAATLALSLYLFANSRTSLWDRDEPFYARAAVEMRESGDYLVPTFNGRTWTDKPVLFYWLMAGAMEVFGNSEFACRFWSALGMAASCLVVFAAGKRLLDATVGLWAMLILASSLMSIGTGTLAIIDAILLAIMSLVMLAFAHALTSRPRVWHALVMGAGLGLGMLAKGPIGMMPLLAIAVALYAARNTGLRVRRLLRVILVAAVIGGLMFLAWAIPVSAATNGHFLRAFLAHDVLTRAVHAVEGHGGNLLLFLPYYVIVVVVGFFPWTLFVSGGLSAMVGMRLGGELGRPVLLGWTVPIPLVMTFAGTKLPHYILFIWPGLALLTAATLIASERNQLDVRDRRWLRNGRFFFAPVAVLIAIGFIVGPWFAALPGLRAPGIVSGLVVLGSALMALRLHARGQYIGSAKVLLAGMVVLQAPLWLGLLPALEQIKVTPAIGRVVNSRTPESVPVAAHRFLEPSLNFYVGRHVQNLATAGSVVDWAGEARPGILVIPKNDLHEIQDRYGALPLAELAETRGVNYSKGKPVDILVLVRKGGAR